MRRRLIAAVSCCLGGLLSCSIVTEAAPAIALPFNAQVPPVAIVDQTFYFQFSESTFASDTSTLAYSLKGAPSWLALENSTRTLTGSPGQEDVGTATMQLIASDSTGATAMSVTLYVTEERGPELNPSVSTQLQTSGTVTNTDAVLYYPSLPISVAFSRDTFTNTNSDTEYYATCANNTPLPSWLAFDQSNLSFSGSPPPFLSPYELPQIYAIRLMATNVPGFYTAQATFVVTVATHKFYFEDSNYTILATPGQQVAYEGLQDKLLLDGKPAAASSLKSVRAVTPTWLSFDETTLKFSGTAPLNLRAGAVAVFAEDIYGGTANTTVAVASGSTPELITEDIGPLQATIGEDFTYKLNKNLFAQDGTSTTIGLGEASSWLRYDNTTLVLSGKVPADLTPRTLPLTLTATQNGITQEQNIVLELDRGALNRQPSTPSNPVAPTTQPQAGYNIANDPMRLAAAIIIPIIVVLALLLLAFCLRRQRLRAARKQPSRWDRWICIPCIGLVKRRRQQNMRQRIRVLPGARYSYMDRGPTPQMGVAPTPPIEPPALVFKKQQNGLTFRPLSDIGQTSRPGSFVRQLTSNRWSLHHHAHDQSGPCSQCEFSIAEEPLGSNQADTQALLQTESIEQESARSARLARAGPQGRYSNIFGPLPTRSLRQSYALGIPQDDRPGRRSVHGLGHGRPFPEQDIPSTVREESMLSGTWTDTTGSLHAPMNSNSSGGSSIGFPPRAQFSRSPAPQMVRQVRPTIRQVSSPPPQSEHARRETATSGSRSTPRPPSFHSFLEARHEVVRKAREKDSTSFSGYRSSRKSSSGKDTASISVIEEDVPAVPVRLRPALDPQEMVRVSRFYSSTNGASSAQRKGSMIHDRFREPRTESPVTYDLAEHQAPHSPWPLPEEPDALPAFVARRRSKSSTHSDINRRDTLLLPTGAAEDSRLHPIAPAEFVTPMPMPLTLGKRRSWTAGEDESLPVEEEKGEEMVEIGRRVISRASPPANETIARQIVIPKRRPVAEDPRNVGNTGSRSGSGSGSGSGGEGRRQGSAPPQNDIVDEDVDGRDVSFRFL